MGGFAHALYHYLQHGAVEPAHQAWLAAAPGSLQQLDERSTDFIWRLSASPANERRVIIIDIDDASLAQVGPWPWPREVMAELTRKLDEQGVGLKLFDVVFPDGRGASAELSRALIGRTEIEDDEYDWALNDMR